MSPIMRRYGYHKLRGEVKETDGSDNTEFHSQLAGGKLSEILIAT